MKKQFIILLAVVSALMVALFLASCGSSGGSNASSAATSEAAQAEGDATDEGAAEEGDGADESAEGAAEEGEEAVEASQASADADGYVGLPAFQPSDHEGRTYEQCPTCHDGSTAPAIPDDHFINGELDGARLQCVTCHVVEPA